MSAINTGYLEKLPRLLSAALFIGLAAACACAAAAGPSAYWSADRCELLSTPAEIDTEAIVKELVDGAAKIPILQLAFVVGNQSYGDSRLALKAPAADAEAFCRTLRSSEFLVRRLANLESRAFHLEVKRLVAIVDLAKDSLGKRYPNAQKKIVVYFYYSGHGFGWNGENFLLPIDLPKDLPIQEATDRSVSVDFLIGKLRPSPEADGRGRIGVYVVIDACRNIPRGYFLMPDRKAALDGNWFYRQAINFGGMYAFYATGAGSYARDGDGQNQRSIFTEHFISVLEDKRFNQAGPFDFFAEVSRRVRAKTGNAQQPEFYGSPGAGSDGPVPGAKAMQAEPGASKMHGWIFAGNRIKGADGLSDLNVRSTDKNKKIERVEDLAVGQDYVLTDAVRVREQRPSLKLCENKAIPSGNYGECVRQVGLAVAGKTVRVIQAPEAEKLATRDQYWLNVEVIN